MKRATLTLLLLAMLAARASAADPSITVLPTPDRVTDLTPGADGVMWGLEHHETPEETPTIRVVRLTSRGIVSRVQIPTGLRPLDSNGFLHPLPDGSMGLFLQRLGPWRNAGPLVTGLALMRFSPGRGTITRTTDLPAQATGSSGVAIAPDGAIWFARSCQDELARVSTAGVITRVVRLPQLGCGSSSAARERGAGLAFDVTGALWLVNRCMGRVDRVSISGRVREWWTPPEWCSSDPYEFPLAMPAGIVVDPRGGISFDTTPTSGSPAAPKRHGRGARFPARGAGVFAPDGALWSIHGTGVARGEGDTVAILRAPKGSSRISNLAATRSGSIALVRGSFWKSFDPQIRESPITSVYLHPSLVAIRSDGSEASGIALPDGGPEATTALSEATMVLGPDGAQWLSESRAAFEPFHNETFRGAMRIVRVLPPDSAPPRVALARVRHVARLGRALWLQLSCGAELARFCSGTVRLARAALVDAATPYTIPGSLSGAVRLRLSDRAAFVLRHRGLTVTVIVRTRDATETRQRVRLQAIVRGRPAA
jgi:hypothetical protein